MRNHEWASLILRSFLAALSRNLNVVFFFGGFAFDFLTLDRIDASLDLILQGLYILGVTVIFLFQVREDSGRWSPAPKWAKAWSFNIEALHFLYGALLSAYIIFYAKSSSGRSGAFLVLIGLLMVFNELPILKRAGHRLKFGLQAFCTASFLNYLLPVLLGRMGDDVFAAALGLTLVSSVGLLALVNRIRRSSDAWKTMSWAPAAVLALMALFYTMRWIPPVPLSLQYGGIYHHVVRKGNEFVLTHEKPPWYWFWRKDDRMFKGRPGDKVYCFVRIFAPTGFNHTVILHWQTRDPATGRYKTSDRIPLKVHGGRGNGYRGFAFKRHHKPGRWRVDVETSHGRVIGRVPFLIESAEEGPERVWQTRKM